jgi:hypothetical protein
MLALIALIVFIFLMMAWLGGGVWGYSNPDGRPGVRFMTNSLVPWACVFILALFAFGAFGSLNTVFTGTTVIRER